MSYLDFERGISAETLRKQREAEAVLRVQSDMTARWRESERILSILRTIGSIPREITGMEPWFNAVRKLDTSGRDPNPRTPNEWFTFRFPEAASQFGPPFFESAEPNLYGAQVQIPSILNEDFFAALLAGERRLGHRMVYCPGDGFWFHDPRVDAFCATSDTKVELLLSNYLVKCSESTKAFADTKLLVTEHRRPATLSRIVTKAKTVLEADPCFFEGANGQARYIEGKRVLPLLEPSPQLFIKSAITKQEGALMSASEAYLAYITYCDRNNLPKTEYSAFKASAGELIYERFQLRIRHDIKTDSGTSTHGWKHIALLPEPPEQQEKTVVAA
jgi:hypothetical protein